MIRFKKLGRTAGIGHGITDDSTDQIEVRQGLTGPIGQRMPLPMVPRLTPARQERGRTPTWGLAFWIRRPPF
jgi:hypothetical protein